jgi:hypothetical protein
MKAETTISNDPVVSECRSPAMTDSQFSVAWNRVCKWRRHGNELWVYEAILCGRTLLNGRPTLKIAARLAAINEERVNENAAPDLFWQDARRKLGRMSRLSQRDIWQIERMVAERPVPQWSAQPPHATV